MRKLESSPFWWEDARPANVSAPESFPSTVDVAVIGAGYTGLSAACRLAAAGRDVLVLDSRAPGFGASTRNGGMVGSGTRLDLDQLSARLGSDRARGIMLESYEAVDHLESTLIRYGISCNFRRTGRVLAAWSPADLQRLRQRAKVANRLREGEAEILDAQQLAAEGVASPRYCGGMLLKTHGAVQPARLHAGLLARARALGTRFAFSTAVTGIDRGHSGSVLRLRRAELRANEVIVATNGYTGRELGWPAQLLLPIPSFMIASQPLPAETLARMLPRDRMIVETRARHCYFRRSHDGRRLLLGGRASMMNIHPSRAAGTLARLVANLFPDERLTYSHCWSGFVAFSADFLPIIERRHGVTFVGGYCGNGVALSVYLGGKAALRILNDPQGQTAFAEQECRPALMTRLPRGITRLAATVGLRCRDLVDNRRRRRA